MFYIYILESLKDNKFYIGQTSNLQSRLNRHNTGKVIATRNRRPFKLVYSEKFSSRKKAMAREHQLKNMKSHKYIEWLIKK